MIFQLQSVEELAGRVFDGAKIAVPGDRFGVPMELSRALVRSGVKDLHLVTVPASGLMVDFLIGAGCVGTIETSGCSLSEFGVARRFMDAVKSGSVRLIDATCPAIYAGLAAAERGLPFMPIRGIIGSDLIEARDDWKVVQNPLADEGEEDPILVVKAIKPDFAVFHAPMADSLGNVWIGRERDLISMAHAAKEALVTVEEVIGGDMFADERLTAGAMSALYVGGIAQAERGSWPMDLPARYGVDPEHLAEYAKLAESPEGFSQYLERHVFGRGEAA